MSSITFDEIIGTVIGGSTGGNSEKQTAEPQQQSTTRDQLLFRRRMHRLAQRKARLKAD